MMLYIVVLSVSLIVFSAVTLAIFMPRERREAERKAKQRGSR